MLDQKGGLPVASVCPWSSPATSSPSYSSPAAFGVSIVAQKETQARLNKNEYMGQRVNGQRSTNKHTSVTQQSVRFYTFIKI